MTQETLRIGSRAIGEGQPVFVIAEAGVNHNGDPELARALVHEAKACGAHCVKFQTFKAERIVIPAAPKADYQLRTTAPEESQLAMLRKLELPADVYPTLMKVCVEAGIEFLSTPYSAEDVEFLVGRCDEHINNEFRQFLLDRGCPAAVVGQAGY